MKKLFTKQAYGRRLAARSAAPLLSSLLAFAAVPAVNAQDSGPLLDALARKGVFTDQEAEELRVELSAENNASLFASIAKGKATQFLSFSGRLQTQYAGIDTNATGVSSTNHLFLRRVYIGMDATLSKNFSASFNYDFAGKSFDKAFLSWSATAGSQEFSIDAGLRKVNFGHEENLSSGSLDAIERSGATRYFAEDNNGRRLGAASYRIGVFFDGNKNAASGKTTGIFYGAAITNPERVSDVTSIGDKVTNTFAFWGNVGYSGKVSSVSFLLGAGFGYLPGQGGVTGSNVTTEKDSLAVGSLYGSLKAGDFTLKAELLLGSSENDKIINTGAGGAIIRQNTSPWGFWVQPSYKITENLELVARYSYLDSDLRGVKVSDGVRSAPASLTANTLHEYYAGLNYYFLGNDVKFQLGYVGGRATREGKKSESVSGLRSQIQINF
ncbi:MAG: OprO/OprP family phosphate-selective porin [Puniceicoccales bacterium]|jgi:hypothetical protein|nr:OprO/OprP family phosphate-selective porin [Puniceicoccales bacterium]